MSDYPTLLELENLRMTEVSVDNEGLKVHIEPIEIGEAQQVSELFPDPDDPPTALQIVEEYERRMKEKRATEAQRLANATGLRVFLHGAEEPLAVPSPPSGEYIDPARRSLDAAVEAANKPDMVNHPPHYTFYQGLEIIDLTEQMNFCKGNAVKYICRAGLKNPDTEIEDLEKAIWYLKREIERIQKRP